jgi:hypothetical protein
MDRIIWNRRDSVLHSCSRLSILGYPFSEIRGPDSAIQRDGNKMDRKAELLGRVREGAEAEPLGLFDLANRWGEVLKVIGAGNGAGLVAAGVALSSFAKYETVLPYIKIGGICFFVGVFAFAFGFASVQLAIFTHDEMLHAVRNKDRLKADSKMKTLSSVMKFANRLALVSAFSFLAGLLAGFRAFLAF